MVHDERRRSGKDSSRARGFLRSTRANNSAQSQGDESARGVADRGATGSSGRAGKSSRTGGSFPSRLRSTVDSSRGGKDNVGRVGNRKGESGRSSGANGRATTKKSLHGATVRTSSSSHGGDIPRGAAVPKKMRSMEPRSGNHSNPSREKQAQTIRHGRTASGKTRVETDASRLRRVPPTSSQASRGGPLPRSIRNNRQTTQRSGLASILRNKKLVVTVSLVLVLIIALLGVYTVLKNALAKMDANSSAPAATANFDPVQCTPDMLEVTLARQGSRSGQAVNFNISIKNDKGERPCYLDIGYKHAGIKIWSGEQPVWDSKVCNAGEASKVLLLDKNLTSAQTITWDGNVYGANCSKQYPSKAGTYQAQFSIDSVDFGSKLAFSLDPNGKSAQAVQQQGAPQQNQPTVQPSPDPNVKSDIDGDGSAVDKADPEKYKSDAPSDVTGR
ncbi:hypothetical protein [Arcanobacterium bovis]|uniref:Uncharacterized protein n=1 Tax=Arcanobacterium bovis TaxID=2529275 RepID=A0A4Q9V1F0_9ACTO|nr:hypothetical protein [Arcanobacterium bovis]TBW21501.1 hypothetical protein EZJ44_06055 [Arcanobacterium bovis]